MEMMLRGLNKKTKISLRWLIGGVVVLILYTNAGELGQTFAQLFPNSAKSFQDAEAYGLYLLDQSQHVPTSEVGEMAKQFTDQLNPLSSQFVSAHLTELNHAGYIVNTLSDPGSGKIEIIGGTSPMGKLIGAYYEETDIGFSINLRDMIVRDWNHNQGSYSPNKNELGLSGEMYWQLQNNLDSTSAFAEGVVLHEYTHRLTDRMEDQGKDVPFSGQINLDEIFSFAPGAAVGKSLDPTYYALGGTSLESLDEVRGYQSSAMFGAIVGVTDRDMVTIQLNRAMYGAEGMARMAESFIQYSNTVQVAKQKDGTYGAWMKDEGGTYTKSYFTFGTEISGMLAKTGQTGVISFDSLPAATKEKILNSFEDRYAAARLVQEQVVDNAKKYMSPAELAKLNADWNTYGAHRAPKPESTEKAKKLFSSVYDKPLKIAVNAHRGILDKCPR